LEVYLAILSEEKGNRERKNYNLPLHHELVCTASTHLEKGDCGIKCRAGIGEDISRT
jgi:hypothetical protein